MRRKGSIELEEINLSKRVSLDEEGESFTGLFKQCFKLAEDKDYSCKVNLTKSEFIYPSALIFLLALQESLKDRKVGLEWKIKEGSPVHEYLIFSGAKKYFAIPGLPKDLFKAIKTDESKVYLMSGSEIAHVRGKAEKLVDMFKCQQEIHPSLETKLIESIEEILRNMAQHSKFTKYYILDQTYPKSHRIRYVFYDNGMGIKPHLTRNGYEGLLSFVKDKLTEESYNKIEKEPANLAIKEASKYMITGTDNQGKNSGAGLDFLLSVLLPVSKGTITILSEDGMVQWADGKNRVKDFDIRYKIKGTLVSITVDCKLGTQPVDS